MHNLSTSRSIALAATLLLTCISACTAALPTPAVLQVEAAYFAPPQPFNGSTYITVEGRLPDGCTKIDQIDHSVSDNTFLVTINTGRPPGVACTQEASPFKETIRVETGNLYAGTYTVIVNGASYSFPMDQDFIIPLTPDPGS